MLISVLFVRFQFVGYRELLLVSPLRVCWPSHDLVSPVAHSLWAPDQENQVFQKWSADKCPDHWGSERLSTDIIVILPHRQGDTLANLDNDFLSGAYSSTVHHIFDKLSLLAVGHVLGDEIVSPREPSCLV